MLLWDLRFPLFLAILFMGVLIYGVGILVTFAIQIGCGILFVLILLYEEQEQKKASQFTANKH